MNNLNCLGKVSALLFLLFAVQFCESQLFAQNKKNSKPDSRGLKVSRMPNSGQQRNTVTEIASTASDKPQLIVQLGHGASISRVAFSPDGHSLLTVSSSTDNKAILWEVATGAELRRFSGHSQSIVDISFSPDGRFVLTGGHDKTARLWDVATGAEIRRFEGQIGPVLSVAFSPDGSRIFTGSISNYERGRKVAGDMIVVWEASTGKLLRSFPAHLPVSFSPDARLALTGREDNTARLLDTTTGQEIRRFEGHTSPVTGVEFSPDGRIVLTQSGTHRDETSKEDRSLRLWDAATGKEIRRFDKTRGQCAFSPDGSSLLTQSSDEEYTALLLDTSTGEETARFKNVLWPLGFSPDGRSILTVDANNLRFWDIATRKQVQHLGGYSSGILSVSFSPDGRFILTGSSRQTAQLWDANTGQQIQRYDCGSGSVGYAALSSDGRFVFTHGFNNPGRLWDAATGGEIRRIYGNLKMIENVALSPDGRYVFTGGFDNPARLWDTATGHEVRRLIGYPGSVDQVTFSRDGLLAVTFSYNKEPWRWVCVWDVESGREQRRFKIPIHMGFSAAISPDNRFILIGGATSRTGINANLFDLATGRHIRSFTGHSSTVGTVAFSPDGRFILTGSWDHTARLWNATTGQHIRTFKGHSSSVWSVAFSPDGRFVLTGSLDSTTRLWRPDTGEEICRLVSLDNGNWVATDPYGRFDTNDLDNIKGLHWILPDNPLRSLPAEVFMRDYYEPRLLSRILAEEKFQPVKSLSDLNRIQPKVSISSILYQGELDIVTVSVEVSGATGQFQRGSQKVEVKTGVYDLRLFRDGQMVGYEPATGGEIKTDPATGRAVVTFRNVKLPRKIGVTQTEFSAYAFNVDGVKSATDRKAILLAKELPPINGRAYVITMGVNAYEDSDFDLSFAANDARLVQSIVADRLSKMGAYEDVVQIPLISDYEIRDGKRVVVEKTATKDNLKTLLQILSGKRVDPELKKNIPNADKLRRARPEDLVLISFSSHGFADDNGNFYFVPYDTGQINEQGITESLVKRCISSEELALWLRDVDAGEMVMIADACHSAATINVKGFKPGPMGSRGLGQLAYDKGMRILTSTQANDVALESELIKQGLLTYALTHDGIEAQQADFKPKDNIITLAEWLEYGVRRVPMLYEEVKKGEVQNFGQGKQTRALVPVSSKEKVSSMKDTARQQPSLFDFARKKQGVILVKQN